MLLLLHRDHFQCAIADDERTLRQLLSSSRSRSTICSYRPPLTLPTFSLLGTAPTPCQAGAPPRGRKGELRPARYWAESARHPAQAVTVTDTRLYGKATAQAWDRLHPRLTRRAAWIEYDGPLPIIEGTVIRLAVEKLLSGGVNKPVWLWWSGTGASTADVDRCWQCFLRRFDLEHTFRLFKQTLGWTKPRLRSSEAADRWTWLVLAAYAQLRLARPLATDLRRPWEKPTPPNRLTLARVRRGFRNLRMKTAGSPAGAPTPCRPGPGRPPGSKNRRTATRHDVGRVLATGEAYSRPAHHKKGAKPRRTVTGLSDQTPKGALLQQ